MSASHANDHADAAGRGTPISSRTLRIVQARALSYRVPGSSRVRPLNYIVDLRGQVSDGAMFNGLGEGQARGSLTGDNAGSPWAFLEAAAAELEGYELSIATRAEAVDSIKRAMNRFAVLAGIHRTDSTQDKPFRGMLMGLEMALLDVSASAQNITVARLLGQVRARAPISPPQLPVGKKPSQVRASLKAQGDRHNVIRIRAGHNIDKGLKFVRTVAKAARRDDVAQGHKTIWIDFNGALDIDGAHRFIDELLDEAINGDLLNSIIIEQPVPAAEGDQLPVLQQQIDSRIKTAETHGLTISIMADQSLRDVSDVERMQASGEVAALNVRPAQIGGLIPSIELVSTVLDKRPNAFVALTRMRGASRITRAGLTNLALALPKVDGVMVVSSVERHVDITATIREPGDLYNGTYEVESSLSGAEHQSDGGEALEPSESTDDVGDADGDEYDTGATDVDDDDEVSQSEGVDELNPAPEGTVEAVDHEEVEVENPKNGYSQLGRLRAVAGRNVPGLGVSLRYHQLIKPTINYVTFPAPPAPSFEGKTARTYDDVDYIRPLGPYGVHGHVVEREALAYGLNTKRYNKSTFLVGDGKKEPLAFRTARWPLSSVVASSIVRHKESTRLLLGRHGVPVPMGRTFAEGDNDGALKYAERIEYPVVLKPAEGSMGVGVTANIADASELRSALGRLQESVMGTGEFIVEKHIPGNDYRIMVLGEKVVAAVERMPASVLGDGRSTVAELILAKNAARKQNSHLGPLALKWNSATEYELGKQGIEADTVLPEDRRLYLNSVNNLTQGGDSVEVLDELHPSIIEASVEAVKAVPGLMYCGVDFLLEDHRKSLTDQIGAVCELNAVAAIPVAEYPMFGEPRPLSREFMTQAIKEFDLDTSATRAETLNIHMKVRGKVTGVGYGKWFAQRANRFECSGWIRKAKTRELEIRVSGPTAAVTALAAAAVLGPARSNPTSVHTTHRREPLTGAFRVVSTSQTASGGSDL